MNMFVVKIGGSLLYDDNEQINAKLISKYAKTIKNVFEKENKKCVIIVGGGKLARKFIEASRSLGATEAYNDVLGIEMAKLNARLLISALGSSAYPNPPNSYQEFQKLTSITDEIIVCGGFQPGQSTNAVAAIIAETLSAKKLINLTNVDGVYSEDPKKNPDAKLLAEISIDDFSSLVNQESTKAGYYPLFDITALQIIQRSKIHLHFVNGFNTDNIEKALLGKNIGTQIIF
ncbi:MAG: UMP kinase [Asgard group archaeon]|nr:UMP kinase [Asgard group archaeon]